MTKPMYPVPKERMVELSDLSWPLERMASGILEAKRFAKIYKKEEGGQPIFHASIMCRITHFQSFLSFCVLSSW